MLSIGLERYRQSWNAFDRVGIPLYNVEMFSTTLEYLCTGLKCFLWVGKPSRGLECFRQSWNTFVQGCNAFHSVGMLSTELEYLCTG
jgi:hypothetical protein